MSEPGNAKVHARDIIERLPETASWDDVMYELYVRESIDAGLADVAADGSTVRFIPDSALEPELRWYEAAGPPR